MTKIKILLAYCCVLILLFISCNNTAETSKSNTNLSLKTSRILTDQQWIEDLDELYAHLKTDHRNIYHTTKSAKFEELYFQIKKDIPDLSDQEVIVQFAGFVALANDGHTRLTLPLQEGIGLNQAHSKTPLPSDSTLVFRHLPMEFYWFDDGLHISSATKSYRQHIGKKVLMINETTINKALERVRAISHYDNESGYKLIAPSRLSILEVLKALKISQGNDEIRLTIEQNGIKEEIIVIPLKRFSETTFFDHKIALENETEIISRRQNDVYYWYEYLEHQKTVYLQLNQMNAAATGPGLIKFIGELDEFNKKNEVNRLILDLRNNFGGSNSYSLLIANLIIKNPELNKIGSFYTLIGRKTFSAAQYLVNDLGKWTNVIYVGEPTGASPNHYGDSKKKQLSNSNLTVRISSVYWRDWTSDENRKAIVPDITVENNASDFFQNTDAALNTCINFKASKELVDTYTTLYETGGMKTAERLYLRVVLDWEQTTNDVSKVEEKLVEWMSDNNEE